MSDGFYANPGQIVQAGSELPGEIPTTCYGIINRVSEAAAALRPAWGNDATGDMFAAQMQSGIGGNAEVLDGAADVVGQYGGGLVSTGNLYGNSNEFTTDQAKSLGGAVADAIGTVR